MRRGDVVRTVAELEALPVGTEVVDMDARRFKTSAEGAYPCDALGIASIQYPALVRVVGPVEPEWLETAARAARDAVVSGRRSWSDTDELARVEYRKMARAAVAAADKARGIVNSREEFDALPAGTRVTGPRTGVYRAGATPPYPPGYPCIVLD